MKKKNRKRWLVVLVAFVSVLVALRIAAPAIIKSVVNDRLAEAPHFRAHVGDIDLALWKATAWAHDIKVVRRDSPLDAPLATVDTVKIAMHPGAFFEGRLISDIEVEDPEITLIEGPSDATSQSVDQLTKYAQAFKKEKPVKERAKFLQDRVRVKGGTVTLIDRTTRPNISVRVSDLNVEADDVYVHGTSKAPMPMDFRVNAVVQGKGKLEVTGQADANAAKPTFDVNIELRKLPLEQLNEISRAYSGMDFKQGAVSFYMELAASAGEVTGYAKPMMAHAETIEDTSETLEEEGLWTVTKELFTDAAIALFEDDEHDRVATRIPIEGTIKNPDISAWVAGWQLFRNAFIESLAPDLRGTIGPADVLAGGDDVSSSETGSQ